MRYVAVVVEDLADYQYQLLQGLVPLLSAQGLGTVVVAAAPRVPGAPSRTQLAERVLTAPGAFGLVATPLADGEDERRVVECARTQRMPVVSTARMLVDAPTVGCDNEPGMTALVRHLINECDVRRPAFLAGHSCNVDGVQREAVFRRELMLWGVPFTERRRLDGAYHRGPAEQAVRRLLDRGTEFDAVVAVTDDMALGALDALHAAGRAVPEEVVVTGFDDAGGARRAGLTTVAQDLSGQGEAAARSVLDLAAGRAVRDVLVPSSLVVRATTRAGATPPAPPRPHDPAEELGRRLAPLCCPHDAAAVLATLPAELCRPLPVARADALPWAEIEALGPCVVLQALGTAEDAVLAYAPGDDPDLPRVAEVLKSEVSRVQSPSTVAADASQPSAR